MSKDSKSLVRRRQGNSLHSDVFF
ncbi:Protein CBG26542 [Caenorhabditis briggsae]|uniref:Protein CBG26542 n=1 Tax=Caenorhabditis briggsae TaxID=6238 RepID=B6IIX3_CAEBR|nr:Protein CBG26542 [Caenorhabditis briggsae]CAR99853.1 Protein CBG26542 [Caenorhabditis briggsae]